MSDGAPLDFNSLRLRGLKWLQTYAGERWTDYNVHDPGVTLLEALAYGLTDLAYRVDFETADLLARRGNTVDLAALGLLPPEEALPSRPATLEDWRAVILDVDARIENAWVEPVPGDAGLLQISLLARSVPEGEDRAALAAEVRRAFHANRNAGEDTACIGFVREIPCRLEVTAEIERDREPEAVVADIFDRCGALLTAGVRAIPFEELRRQGLPLDAVFLGPLGQCGLFDRGEMRRSAGSAIPQDLLAMPAEAPERFFRAVGQIEDVRFVQHLRLVPLAGSDDALAGAAVLVLGEPRNQSEAETLVLSSRGRRLPVDPQRLRYHCRRVALDRAGHLRPQQSPDAVIQRPAGQYRAVDQYTLVQSHLPRLYHVTPQGLPDSAPAEVKARARQLRGYLLAFEQCLADFLHNLSALPDVFAARNGLRGYGHSPAPGAGLPGADRYLYPDGGMAGVGADYVDEIDRRGRVLDYLLALYGESFSQNSLRTFDLYHIGLEKDEAVLANRERFLAHVAAMTRDRGGGGDLLAADDPGGLTRRLALLLDLRPGGGEVKLSAALGDRASDFYWHPEEGRRRHGRVARNRFAPPDEPLDGLVLLRDDGADLAIPDLILALREYGLMRVGPVHPSLVVYGGLLDRYAIRRNKDGWWLLLDDGAGDDVLVVGLFREREHAARAANLIRRLSIALCRAGEGVFVVEEALLRPRSSAAFAAPLHERLPRLQLTAVFSGWTARTAQPGFRTLAAETVRINCPAHLATQCRWLPTFDAMQAFETAFETWRADLSAHLCQPDDAALAEQADRSALALAARLDEAPLDRA